jgi:hypothetical protein
VVRHQVLVLAFGGSSPSSPAKHKYFCYNLFMKYTKQVFLLIVLAALVILAKIASSTSIGCHDPNTCTKLPNGSEACTLIGYTCPTNSLAPKLFYLAAVVVLIIFIFSLRKLSKPKSPKR